MALKAGAKTAITAEPLDLSGYPEDRAERRIRFIEDFIIAPHGKGGGKPLKLYDWQKEIIRGVFGKGIRTGLVAISRGNGKTALSAALAVAELFLEPLSPQVLVVASDQRQSSIALNMARRMIELNDDLAERTHIYKDALKTPLNDGEMMALPADPAALHGWRPSLLLIDELHAVNEAVYEAVVSAGGKSPDGVTLAISTPAASSDSVMWRLVQHGRDGEDSSFYLKEYSAPEGCDLFDREAWKVANPALGTFLSEDGLASAIKTMREPAARQLRLGQWITGADTWLPFGAWAELEDSGRTVDKRERICLGFDGSVGGANGDSTALVGCTIGETPHIFVLGLWETDGTPDWKVSRRDVDRAVVDAFQKYNVVMAGFDPWHWRGELEQWADRFGRRRVVEWDSSFRKRACPATDKLYAAVMDQRITHDGNERLAAHVAHAHVTRTPQGDALIKEKRSSGRKIDLLIAALVAHDLATNTTTTKRRRSAGFN